MGHEKGRALQKQLARSFQLGLLAKDMVRLRHQKDHRNAEKARGLFVERLGLLHGLPQKIGQILSLTELTEEEQVYTPLTESQATLSPEVAFSEIEKSLGARISDCFQSIEEKGISASLGQVHPAVLLDGRKVAVKIQYPGIEETLKLDLRALGWLSAPIGGLRRGFDLAAYRREVGCMLAQELDYRQEAEMIQNYRLLTSNWNQVWVPEVVEEFSGERILTMTWVEGEPFSSTLTWPLQQRRALSTCLLRLFLSSVFKWGVLHADPHPGNYRFHHRNGRVVVGLLDFGCVKRLEAQTVEGLAGLIADVIDGQRAPHPDEVLSRFVEMGFSQQLLSPMADRLIPLSQVLFEPFFVDRPFSLSSWNLGQKANDILGEFRWNFRFAGPAQMIFFMRAYQGLIKYLEALDAPINWRAALEEAWESLKTMPPTGLAVQGRKEKGKRLLKSERLRIKVMEADQTKVEVTFGAAAAENLPDLVPEETRAKLDERDIDLDEIVRDVVARDFEPGELFHLKEGTKSIRVWLE